MIVDAHAHLFSPSIVAHVTARPGLAARLRLDVERAPQRLGPEALVRAARAAGVTTSLLLPTARREKVREVNERFVAIAARYAGLVTLGTLHPEADDVRGEIDRLRSAGVGGVKLCSFSQRFDPEGRAARRLFASIEARNEEKGGRPLFVVLDTFARADRDFGAPPAHVTTPEVLGRLVAAHRGIDFVAAHMGGLTAPFDAILGHLPPSPNLHLDTSNAAHTLGEEAFVRLLARHGPEAILFGTDWPWFHPKEERERIGRLLGRAGFDRAGRALVFGGNAERLLAGERRKEACR